VKRFLILLVVLGAVVLLLNRKANHSGPGSSDLVLSVAPSATTKDPGPQSLVGAESEPAGTQFISADLMIDGPGDVRIYFDRKDNTNFHFMDRSGDKVSLGLCEAGLEQIFCSGKMAGAGSLRIARHGPHVGLFQQGRLLLSAFDDRLMSGSAGLRMLNGGTPVALKVEPREDVHFADDFMTNGAKGEQWRGNGSVEKGDFAPKSLRHPLLSANAFNYMGWGKGIYSVAGNAWWDHYRYDASLRGPAGAAVGLVFAYQDDKNYGLFRWSARKSDASGVTDAGKREIIRYTDGQPTVVAQAAGGYLPDQWYAAQVQVGYSRVTISIDGHIVLEGSDPSLTCGAAGVWCDVAQPAYLALDPKAQAFQVNSLNELMQQHAVFDDVRVNTVPGYEDQFTAAGSLGGGWLVGTGDWSVKTEKDSKSELTVLPVKGATKALIGDRHWAQYEVEGDVRPGSGAAGVVFLHRDESNYYYATVDKQVLKLVGVLNGVERVVDSTPMAITDQSVHLKARVKHGHVLVTADGGKSVEVFAGDTMLRGRAGFVAAAGREAGKTPAAFSHFKLAFLPEAEPLVTTNAVFEDELTMNDWTSPTSEWYPPRDQVFVDGKPVNLLWHRSQFPGDVELVVEPREFPEQRYEIALSVAKDGQGKNNGYVFRYKAGDAADGPSRTSTVQLIRQGEVVAEKPLSEDPRQLSTVALRRCGKYIVGILNGRPVVSYRDEAPLVGSKVAYYTQGVVVRTEATKIVSDNFRNDLFSSAPTAWRTAGAAIAEVTNRWQCDPRWSFFSLKNDRKKGKPAVLWSKHLYPGDVTVEFFVGNKMEGERGQPYTYARDINVTICSDGSDLSKGYTFMFGGQGNQGSMILKNGVEVRRCSARIPTDMNFHRHWFSYKVEKQGNRLTFRVDRFFANEKNSDLVFEDSVPITGDHVAIWTYDHAVMISRVRISGDGGSQTEDPAWQPEALKTPLDEK
jgi:hypothetical protein